MIEIEITATRAAYIYSKREHEPRILIGFGPTLEMALIDAERSLRTDLCDLQARLHDERERNRVRRVQ